MFISNTAGPGVPWLGKALQGKDEESHSAPLFYERISPQDCKARLYWARQGGAWQRKVMQCKELSCI